MPSVSASYEQALRVFLHSRGLSVAAASRAGEDASPTLRVAGSLFGQTLTLGGRELGDATPGLTFGQAVGGAGFGLLGVAAATAPTLRESVQRLQRFESLTSTLGHLQIRLHGDLVSLVWCPADACPQPAVVEAILCGWVSFGRFLLAERVDVVEVTFKHMPNAPKPLYEQALCCPVRFGAADNSVVLKAELLDAVPRFAESRICDALDGWLDRCTLTETAPSPAVCARQVAAVLGTDVPLAEADEGSTAALLGLERRTLQRRLAAEGTCFRQLLDAARAQHAIVGVLRGRVPLAQLGADIGFEEQASLCRAFRRWTGYAPLAAKHRLQPIFSELRA